MLSSNWRKLFADWDKNPSTNDRISDSAYDVQNVEVKMEKIDEWKEDQEYYYDYRSFDVSIILD